MPLMSGAKLRLKSSLVLYIFSSIKALLCEDLFGGMGDKEPIAVIHRCSLLNCLGCLSFRSIPTVQCSHFLGVAALDEFFRFEPSLGVNESPSDRKVSPQRAFQTNCHSLPSWRNSSSSTVHPVPLSCPSLFRTLEIHRLDLDIFC